MTDSACPGVKVRATVHRDGYKKRPGNHLEMVKKNQKIDSFKKIKMSMVINRPTLQLYISP